MRPIPQMEPWFDEAELHAVMKYMQSGGWLTEYTETAAFEAALAQFMGVKHCLAVPNGTLALVAALWAVGVRAGDEVIVPNMTMVATANAAVLIGARPVLVDVEAQALGLDPERVQAALTARTRAVMFVSFNGRPGRLAEVAALCRERGVPLIEDAAQALGSYLGERHLGTLGEIGIVSFSPLKIMTTGQGGAVVTNEDERAQELRRLKDFGRIRGGIDVHEAMGFNFKFTDLQAAVGLAQLTKVPARIARKRAMWRRYADLLLATPDVELLPTNTAEITPWFIDIFVPDPDDLKVFLHERGIGSRRVYPPVNAQPAYGWAGEWPVAARAARRGLWLPSAAQLADADIDRVCEAVADYFAGRPVRTRVPTTTGHAVPV